MNVVAISPVVFSVSETANKNKALVLILSPKLVFVQLQ